MLRLPKSDKSTKLIRAYSLIDLKQIQRVSELILKKSSLSKNDLKNIELETVVSNFNGETFFSLFSESDVINETIHDKLKKIEVADSKHESNSSLSSADQVAAKA